MASMHSDNSFRPACVRKHIPLTRFKLGAENFAQTSCLDEGKWAVAAAEYSFKQQSLSG